jgi:hypothetical protein
MKRRSLGDNADYAITILDCVEYATVVLGILTSVIDDEWKEW